MRAQLRRRAAVSAEPTVDEGPFVSFTDLTIGIIFLFLILVAALMLMHQEAMARAKAEADRLREEIRQLQAQLATMVKLDPNDTPFRLGIVYNSFQRPQGSSQEWRYTRTVQIFRAPNGNCLENVIMRNNLNLAWKPAVEPQNVPNAKNQEFARKGAPCSLSGAGERWNSETETGGVDRTGPDLFTGYTVLHTKDGPKTIEIQFRVLGIYDEYFRSGAGKGRLPPPPANTERAPTGAISLQ